MAITRPQLPPKAGYVEVVDENGNHVYKKVHSPVEDKLSAHENHLAEVDEIAIDLYEMNLALEAISAEQDEAIIDIYEMIGGTING